MTRTVTRKGIAFTVEDTPATSSWNFWGLWADEVWEPKTMETIDLFPGGKLLDIGAWVGPITLWAARQREVVAIEPDPVAAGLLRQNIALNPGHAVEVVEACAGAEDENPTILWSVSDEWGMSHSTRTREIGNRLDVAMVDARRYLDGVGVAKVDIEGGEGELLPMLGPALRERGIPLILGYHSFGMTADERAALDLELSRWHTSAAGEGQLLCLP